MFEQKMNLMRRDNPAIPDDYYMNNFISGLNRYIQSQLECLQPTTIQKAMWFARRMENSCPPTPKTYTRYYKKQATAEINKQHVPVSTPAATVIQQAREKGICYKCKEPWFLGHKQVCKMSQKAQIQALQELNSDKPEVIYIIDAEEEMSETEEELDDKQQLKISMHAASGLPEESTKHTFTLQVKVGQTMGLALVDSGSTTTFMSPQAAQQAGCTITPLKRVQVTVANGGKLTSAFSCFKTTYSIQGESFQSDIRILDLTGVRAYLSPRCFGD